MLNEMKPELDAYPRQIDTKKSVIFFRIPDISTIRPCTNLPAVSVQSHDSFRIIPCTLSLARANSTVGNHLETHV